MSQPRRYDHDEARRLREAGVPVREIAERFGVSRNSIYWVTSTSHRQWKRDWMRQHFRKPCIDGCGRLAWHNGIRPGRCVPCQAELRTTTVRDGELRCNACREWKPDQDFSPRSSTARRGRHQTCRSCDARLKREWRAEHREEYNARERVRKHAVRAAATPREGRRVTSTADHWMNPESSELPTGTWFDSPREAALVRALARHREVANNMYAGVGVTEREGRAIEAVISPLLAEIERLQGYCREWAAREQRRRP